MQNKSQIYQVLKIGKLQKLLDDMAKVNAYCRLIPDSDSTASEGRTMNRRLKFAGGGEFQTTVGLFLLCHIKN